MLFHVIENERNKGDFQNASIKPRKDFNEVLGRNFGSRPLDCYFPQPPVSGVFSKIIYQFQTFRIWKDALSGLSSNDVLFVNYPPVYGCFSFGHALRYFQGRVILLVHDLETLRNSSQGQTKGLFQSVVKKEECLALSMADYVIVHNSLMVDTLSEVFNLDKCKQISLGIFDYLLSSSDYSNDCSGDDAVAIAGNLSSEKAGYLSNLPNDVAFNLYGLNLTASLPENARYFGSFDSEELPFLISGKYGLVWDGCSTCTCSGSFGDYLKINNPFKASLYLASGLPLIVWNQSAIARFVVDEDVGIVIDSLDNLGEVLSEISDQSYNEMKSRVYEVSSKVRSGFYSSSAINSVMAKF